MDKSLETLLSSERLTKDVDTLMNSLFWVDALKNKNAKGISDKLNNQLNESQQFMHNFVRYAMNLKRIQFRNILVSQNNEKRKQIQKERQLNLEQIIQNVCTPKSDNKTTFEAFLMNSKAPREINIQEINIVLPRQFLLECCFLAILDSQDYIGTPTEIQNKLIEWLPEMRIASTKIKPLIEPILNGSRCFKRLLNFTKSAAGQQNRPLILSKRQYVWSLNQNFLKPFVKAFYKMFDKKEGTIVDLCEFNEPSLFEMANSHFSIPLTLPLLTSQAINKLSSNSKLFNTTNRRNLAHVINICDFNALFDSWKYKLEQFKLLMHIKHNNFGFSWNDSNLNQKSTENIKPFEFASKSSKPKPLVKRLKSTLKPCKLIERLNQPPAVIKKISNEKVFPDQFFKAVDQPEKETHLEENFFNETIIEMNQDYLKTDTSNQLHLKFDDKDCLENLLSSEDLLKLEESKSFNSMVSDTMVCSNLINIGNCMNSNYFNILPVSPSICNSFFSHQELNVSHMLSTSSVDSGVEGLFCDELKLDGDISIHL